MNMNKLQLAQKISNHLPLEIIRAEFNSDPDVRDYIVSSQKFYDLGYQCEYDLDVSIQQLINAYSIIDSPCMPTTKTIFTNGCFDILHRGHFELLKYCHSLGHVVVGLNSNTSVKRLKGVNRPFFDEGDREFALRSCRFVDNVIIFAEDTPYA